MALRIIHRHPYMGALPLPENIGSTWLEYYIKYPVSRPIVGVKHIFIHSDTSSRTQYIYMSHMIHIHDARNTHTCHTEYPYMSHIITIPAAHDNHTCRTLLEERSWERSLSSIPSHGLRPLPCPGGGGCMVISHAWPTCVIVGPPGELTSELPGPGLVGYVWHTIPDATDKGGPTWYRGEHNIEYTHPYHQ